MTHSVSDPANPHIVLTRHGTAPSGADIDERIVLRHTELTDIDLADLWIGDPFN